MSTIGANDFIEASLSLPRIIQGLELSIDALNESLRSRFPAERVALNSGAGSEASRARSHTIDASEARSHTVDASEARSQTFDAATTVPESVDNGSDLDNQLKELIFGAEQKPAILCESVVRAFRIACEKAASVAASLGPESTQTHLEALNNIHILVPCYVRAAANPLDNAEIILANIAQVKEHVYSTHQLSLPEVP